MKVNESIRKLRDNKKEIKALEDQNKKISQSLIKFMKNQKLTSLVEPDEDITVMLIESKRIEFDVDKLEEKLEPEVFRAITDLHIELDKEELKEIISRNPSIKKQINPALIKTRVLNEGKLNKLLEEELLGIEEIEGAYVTNSITYLKIK